MVLQDSNLHSSKYSQESNTHTENQRETKEAQSHSKEKDQTPNVAQAAQSNINAYNKKQNRTQESQSNSQKHNEKSIHTQDNQMMSVSVQSEPAISDSSSSLENLLQPFTLISDEQQDDKESLDVTIKQPNAPPVTPSIFCVTPSLSCVIYDEWQLENENHDQLSAWKGFNNKFYIQPLTMRQVSNQRKKNKDVFSESNSVCPLNKRKKKDLLTRQMGVRQSSHWISSHNERIKNVGTLKISEQKSEARKTKTEKPNRKSAKTQIRKGRTLSEDFLSNRVKERQDDTPPIVVGCFVDKPCNREKVVAGTRRFSQKQYICNDVIENEVKIDNLNKNWETSENQLLSAVDSSASVKDKCSRTTSRESLHNKYDTIKTDHVTHSTQPSRSLIRHMVQCTGTEVTLSRGVVLSLRSSRPKAQTKYGVQFQNMVPIKNFPPINPLEGISDKKQSQPTNESSKKNGDRRSSEDNQVRIARPHTTETALRGRLLKWYNNDTRRLSMSCMYDRKTRNKFSFHQAATDHTGGQACELHMSRGAPRADATYKSAPLGIKFHTFKETGNLPGCHSETLKTLATVDQHPNCTCEKTHCFSKSVALKKHKTRVFSDLNYDDDDASVSWFGSEVEYSNNKPTKLDVYLQPRESR